MLFERQNDWAALSEEDARQFFIDLAGELALDQQRFTSELDEGLYTDYVTASEQEAVALNLPGTPSTLVNGEVVAGQGLPRDFGVWSNFITSVAATASLTDIQYDAPPPMVIEEGNQYSARVTMESGEEFVLELLPESAPNTVNSFVFLANEGWFDGVTFHRVLPGFVAQTGDPSGTGMGGPGYELTDEIDPELSHEKGVIAMANTGPNSAGSQWYIVLEPAPHLDGSYTIFGRVLEGMDVVEGLTPRDPSGAAELPPGDTIRSVVIEVK